jgi:hypothetical protein
MTGFQYGEFDTQNWVGALPANYKPYFSMQ